MRRAAAVIAVLALSGAGSSAGAVVAVSKLALMPLPARALGAQVAGLPLAADSGVVSNAEAASTANGPTSAKKLAALGELSGFQLDFGGGLPAGAPLSGVETGVELFTTPAAAAGGLSFWQADSKDDPASGLTGVQALASSFAVTGLGRGAWGVMQKLRIGQDAPYFEAELGFRVGEIVASAAVAAARAPQARSLALEDARALEARIAGVLAGRISGPVTTLPKIGPPPGGPNLAAIAFVPGDFMSAKVTQQGYEKDATDMNPVAEYQRALVPAVPFSSLVEQVRLFRDATQASVAFTIFRLGFSTQAGLASAGIAKGSSHGFSVGVGDASFGVVGTVHSRGQTLTVSLIVVRVGSTIEFISTGNLASQAPSEATLRSLAAAAVVRARSALAPKPKAKPGLAA